jgi:hypothetical protein
MPNISVAIINASTVLRDDDVAAAVPAQQKQVSEHLSAVWAAMPRCTLCSRARHPPQGPGG